MRRIVHCVLVLTCYAMMALMATAPHSHDVAPATAPMFDRGPTGSGGTDPDGLGGCPLCAANRFPAAAAPLAAIQLEEPGTASAALLSDAFAPAMPQARGASLRAPPAS